MARILFIHHSTGANLIREGKLRKLLNEINPKLELWDHSYNLYKIIPRLLAFVTHHTGLSDSSGKITGKDYNIVLSNNSPKEYAEIFSQKRDQSPLKEILQYDIVAFKNCYPTSKISSGKQLVIKHDSLRIKICYGDIPTFEKKSYISRKCDACQKLNKLA